MAQQHRAAERLRRPGLADSLQVKLGILDTPIPSEFLAMAPYLVTIVVVAGLVGRSRPPSDYKAYVKE